MMYDTGARVQEIADLTVDCVRIDSEPYTIKLFWEGTQVSCCPHGEGTGESSEAVYGGESS